MGSMHSNLFRQSFLGLTCTQFFGAANDNILKVVLTFMVVDGAWKGDLGEGGQGIVGACFTIPFILLSGYGGQIADRYSKRDVSVVLKWAELPIALVAMYGFWSENLWITLLALVALTSQSAFFGPAKYGMIPEIVPDSDLSRANGTINMMTNIAVIVGTLVGGWVSDHYSPKEIAGVIPELPTLWLPGAALVAFALAGIATVMLLGKLPQGDATMRFDWHPVRIYWESILQMRQTRLLIVMLAWAYFYMLAGISLFILPEYTQILDVSRFEASALMGVMGIAIGVGCATAGLISGHRIEPRLIPIGAAGLTLFFFLLGTVPPKMPEMGEYLRVVFSNVGMFVLGAGFFAGFYIIPLQSLLQKLAPENERGRFLGTANAVSFCFMTFSAFLYSAIAGFFGDQPQRMFVLCALLMAGGAAYFLYRLRGIRAELVVGAAGP